MGKWENSIVLVCFIIHDSVYVRYIVSILDVVYQCVCACLYQSMHITLVYKSLCECMYVYMWSICWAGLSAAPYTELSYLFVHFEHSDQ